MAGQSVAAGIVCKTGFFEFQKRRVQGGDVGILRRGQALDALNPSGKLLECRPIGLRKIQCSERLLCCLVHTLYDETNRRGVRKLCPMVQILS